MSDPLIQLMQAGSLTMTIFAAILILAVTRNLDDPRRRLKAALTMIGFALLLFGFPLYGEVLGSLFSARFGTVARIVAAVLLPYGLYSLVPIERAFQVAEPDEPV